MRREWIGALLGLGLILSACESSSWEEGGSGAYGGGSTLGFPTETPTDGGIIRGDGSASTHPMKAFVDPNASMTQSPGQGVGVFAQYDTGGHWYIWWTCDTNVSGDSCPFTLQISVADGAIQKPESQGFAGSDTLIQSGDDASNGVGSITAETTTTTNVQGVTFDADPGATITLSASLGGEYSGSFLFFVQDHLVNGGYKGLLSDPLELEPSSP